MKYDIIFLHFHLNIVFCCTKNGASITPKPNLFSVRPIHPVLSLHLKLVAVFSLPTVYRQSKSSNIISLLDRNSKYTACKCNKEVFK